MKVFRNSMVMVALIALLAIKSNNADQPEDGTQKLLFPSILDLGLWTKPQKPPLPPAVNPVLQCPTYPPMTPFTAASIVGTWFVYRQSNNVIESGWTCKKMTYGPGAPAAFTYSTKQNGVVLTYPGRYNIPVPNMGTIAVQLESVFAMGVDSMGRVNQFVVPGSTTEFMIIRSCTFYPALPGLLGLTNEYVYVLTKARQPTGIVTTAIAAALTAAGINSAVLQLVDQPAVC